VIIYLRPEFFSSGFFVYFFIVLTYFRLWSSYFLVSQESNQRGIESVDRRHGRPVRRAKRVEKDIRHRAKFDNQNIYSGLSFNKIQRLVDGNQIRIPVHRIRNRNIPILHRVRHPLQWYF
jgi:hypothetical protein